MNNELIKRLYSQIETELEFCDESRYSTVCYNYNTPTLKNAIVKTIAETVLSRKINISQAINEVEKMYSVNDID